MDLSWLTNIAGALVLVIIAGGISRWQRLDLEKDMAIAAIRAFIQLILIGYALDLIFNSHNPLWILLTVAVMVVIAGQTASRRAVHIPHAKTLATISVATGATLTLGGLILLQVFPLEPRYVIPISGMIVGNSMTVTALVMNRLRNDLKLQQLEVEAALALGATGKQAIQGQLRQALKTGMIPIIDSTKTVGLIALPGAMTGMILAGASPLEAVRLQIVVMYMLIGAAGFSGLTTIFLTYPQFFSKQEQLKLHLLQN